MKSKKETRIILDLNEKETEWLRKEVALDKSGDKEDIRMRKKFWAAVSSPGVPYEE